LEKEYKINLEKTQNDVDKITDFKEFIQKQYTIGHKALIELDIE